MGDIDSRQLLLVLTSTYPRWREDTEPRFVHDLCRHLCRHYRVVVLAPHAPGAMHLEIMDEVEVHRFRYAPQKLETLVSNGGIVANLRRYPWKFTLVPAFLASQLFAAWRLVRALKPAAIHVHWLVPQGLIAALLRRTAPKVPIVLTCHGTDVLGLNSALMVALKRHLLRSADLVTVVGSEMRKVVEGLGAPADRILVEPMGVSANDRFVPGGARVERQLLFAGRLVQSKGLHILVAALPAIVSAHDDVHLIVAGGGPQEASVKDQLRALGVEDRVTFLGPVSADRMAELYRQVAITVVPTVGTEGLGLVMVEAAACGCPIVASNVPSLADIFPDRSALSVVPPGNVGALASEICRLLALPSSERCAASESARRWIVQRFDWRSRADAYAAVIGRAISTARGKVPA